MENLVRCPHDDAQSVLLYLRQLNHVVHAEHDVDRASCAG